jgi:ribosome maturation factor RimP
MRAKAQSERRTEGVSKAVLKAVTEQLSPDALNAIAALCEQEGVFLVDVALHGSRERRIVEIFADKPEGITLDECCAVSEKISEFLETTNVFPAAYRLDVSSPGVSRPLQFRWQYERNVGRLLVVELASGESVKGRISTLRDDVLIVDAPKKRDAKALAKPPKPLKEGVVPKFPREISLADIRRAIIEAEL